MWAHTLYVAVEVSRSWWTVALHCAAAGGKIGICRLQAAGTEELLARTERERQRAERELACCDRVLLTYEAGYKRFWLARDIARREAGIEVFINDPASLQTDRVDVRKMVRALKAWDHGDADVMSWVGCESSMAKFHSCCGFEELS